MIRGEKPATAEDVRGALEAADSFYEGLPYRAYEGMRQVSVLSEPKRLRGLTVKGYAEAATIGIGQVNEGWEPPYGWWNLRSLEEALMLIRRFSPVERKGFHKVGI